LRGFADTCGSDRYAVIFTSKRTEGDKGYENTSNRIVELVSHFKGFLGAESVRGADGFGITVSYWDSLKSIEEWKNNAEHAKAKQSGINEWYEEYRIRICRIESETSFTK